MHTSFERVWFWYRLYAGLLVAIYLACVALGALLLLLPTVLDVSTSTEDALSAAISGVLCIVLGLAFGGASLVPLVAPRQPWGWVYGIVLIAIGMTSCCLWPLCIPLLIQWIRPEFKASFATPVEPDRPRA